MRNRNQVVIPLDLGIRIDENAPVRKLIEICDELDYTDLYRTYLRHWRKIDPRTMFELLVFAYMNGIYSSRDIESACRHDIRFMWILQNEPVPDHSTIARFQNERLTGVMEDLFYQLTEKLYQMGELSYKNMFVDGTKIEANANRYTFVWAKAVAKQLEKLEVRIAKEVPEVALRYDLFVDTSLEDCLTHLMKLAELVNLTFVSGKGKHKTQLQRDIELLTSFYERKEGYKEHQTTLGSRKSYSKTDHDATFMRLKEDHMQNGQLKPAYNVQIGVESEYIIGLGLFPNPTDTTTLPTFLDRVQEKSGHRIENIIADAGYASEENYTYLEQNGLKAYIKPADYEIAKTRKFKKDIYRVENMPYDPENDSFTCPNGKKLIHAYDNHRKSDNGYTTTKQNYICESCADCPHREKCFKGQYENRKISLSQTFARQKREAAERINTPEGIKLRVNRSIQVEGAFGVIKEDYGFRKFLTRGKRKTETQFFLLAFAYNIRKLCNRLETGRFGVALFDVDVA